LLIISDMPHPSTFPETYYIYPFIFNSKFRGIFIDISFDKASLSVLQDSPSLEVTFKIGNQEENFEKKIISKDESFFIKPEDEELYCKNNLQCSLTIEIIKKDSEAFPYTFTTNVYSTKVSLEYIYKNKTYDYKLLPNWSKYLYTQINLNEEGIINFDFADENFKIFAKIAEKEKNEAFPDWTGREKFPEEGDDTLLFYDSKKKLINYTKEETKKCDKGCELYIHIASTNNTDQEMMNVEFSVNEVYENKTEEKKEKENENEKEKGKSKRKTNEKEGNAWIIALIITFVICASLTIALFIFKKNLLQNLETIEKDTSSCLDVSIHEN